MRLLQTVIPMLVIGTGCGIALAITPPNRLHDWMWGIACLAAMISHVIILEPRDAEAEDEKDNTR